jgi:HEAT repeats
MASEHSSTNACSEWEQFIVLFAAGEEVSTELHSEWIQHAAQCGACSGALARERELLSLLSEYRSEPEAMLLASCRAGLDDAIDREEEHGWFWRTLAVVFPARWLASGPAWSAAALLLVGFSSGLLLGPRVLHRFISPDGPIPPAVANDTTGDSSSSSPTIPVNSSASLAALNLHTADVAGIDILPSFGDAPPQVQLQLKEQQPVTIAGTVDSDDVKDVLVNILRSGDRFCPDIRLDAVDLLSAKSNDPEVRSALCHAVHNDKNAAVRLKALEALNGAEPQDIVQQTLLDALVDDQNPGVRVEAINSLRDMVSRGEVSSSDKMLSVLQDRMENDPNAYIRLQSAAAIRDLGPRRKF